MAGASLCGLAALGLTACGSGSSGNTANGGNSNSNPVVLGTTDKVVSLDPAGSYDLGSWTVIYNVYQNLLKIPPGGNKPTKDAASCQLTNPTTYTCTLDSGLKFSNGDPLTADDVAYSFNRVVKINDPNGPSSLLASMAKVAATSPTTVVFTLKAPDATWPYVLTTGAGAIVDHKVFPAGKLQPDASIIGSGPYKLTKYTPGQEAAFAANTNYKGDDQLKNKLFIIKYEQKSSTLKLDVEQGNVDIAYRSLTPTDIKSLQGESSKGVKVVDGNGTEIRYLVFNLKTMPGSNDAQKLAIRQAVAETINRENVAKNVYNGTVQPLYSMIPMGLLGHTDVYASTYGQSPDTAKASSTLKAAGVATPVNLTIWYTPSHYGDSSADEYTQIQRDLQASGLFKVTLQSAEWQTYSKAYATDTYPMFQLGWFPDYPDADDYTAPFYLFADGQTGFLNNHYDNPQVNKLIAQEKASADQSAREKIFGQIQQITAKDTPVIPVWQGKQIAAVRNNVTGVESTFDPSFTFRFWLIGKS